MGSAMTFLRTALCAVIIYSVVFIADSSAANDQNLQEAGQQFIGTWESSRSGLCGPCTLRVEKIEENGKAVGTLATDLTQGAPLNGTVVLNEKGRIVLSIITPRGYMAQFDLPRGRYTDFSFVRGEELGIPKEWRLAFKKQQP